MDIRLVRRPHANPMVRAGGIEPDRPVPRVVLATPVVGPSTVALVRHVAELTAADGEARLPVRSRPPARPRHGRHADPQQQAAADPWPGPSSSAWRSPPSAPPVTSSPSASTTTSPWSPTGCSSELPEVARQRHVAAVEAAQPAPDRRRPAGPALAACRADGLLSVSRRSARPADVRPQVRRRLGRRARTPCPRPPGSTPPRPRRRRAPRSTARCDPMRRPLTARATNPRRARDEHAPGHSPDRLDSTPGARSPGARHADRDRAR